MGHRVRSEPFDSAQGRNPEFRREAIKIEFLSTTGY